MVTPTPISWAETMSSPKNPSNRQKQWIINTSTEGNYHWEIQSLEWAAIQLICMYKVSTAHSLIVLKNSNVKDSANELCWG